MTAISSPVVFHHLDQGVDGLLAEVAAGAGGAGQRVRLVDEEDAAERPVDGGGGLLGGVADVLADEVAPGHLAELALRQHAERGEQLPVDAGDGGLTGAGGAGEDQVVAHRADAEAGAAPPRVDLDLVDDGPDLVLHAGQPDHGVELGEQRVDLLRRRGGRRRHRRRPP